MHLSILKGSVLSISIGFYMLLFTTVYNAEGFKCPELLKSIPDACKMIECGNALSKHGCPSNTIYVDKFALCGCCPSCVQYHQPSDGPCDDSSDELWTPNPDCDDKEGYCVVKVNKCLPGLRCNPSTKKCELPGGTLPDRATGECMYRKYLRRLDPPEVHWDPECEADGSFAPKQCKGSQHSGECFCVDREGIRIFGRQWQINAENQTCVTECSRKVHELRKQRLTATIHCTPDGNFEPLQCDTDSGLCYCVDPKTGELDGAVLPESQWKSLPCFSLNLTDHNEDGKYLRKCESEFAGLRQLMVIGSEHGIDIQSKIVNCDYDGSFAPAQIVHTTTQCVFKNGTRIRDFSKPQNPEIDCNCARDKFQYLPSEETAFTFDCAEGTGDYATVYDFGSFSSCVDKDGYLFGDVEPSKYYCCLTDSGCSENIRKACYNNVTEIGIKPCSYWPYIR